MRIKMFFIENLTVALCGCKTLFLYDRRRCHIQGGCPLVGSVIPQNSQTSLTLNTYHVIM